MATNVIRTVILPFLFFVCLLLPVPRETSASSVRKPTVMLNIISITNCTRNKERLPNYLQNVKITRLSQDTVGMSLELIIARIPKTRLQVMVEIFKCADRSVNQCDYVIRVPFTLCELVNAKNKFWTPLFEAVQPPLQCPHLKLGTYKVTNATVNMAQLMDLMTKLPNLEAFNNYWKLEIAIVSNKKDEFCSEFVVKVEKIRMRPT